MIKLKDIIESIDDDSSPITKEEEHLAFQYIIKWLVPRSVEFHNKIVNYSLTNRIINLNRKLGRTTEFEIRKNIKKIKHGPDHIVYQSRISDGSEYLFYTIKSSSYLFGRHIKLKIESPSFSGNLPGESKIDSTYNILS